MGIVKWFKEKHAAKYAPLAMGMMMIAGVGTSLMTGNAAAMDAGTYFSEYSILTYIFGALCVVLAIATIVLKDVRLVIATGFFGALAALASYFNF